MATDATGPASAAVELVSLALARDDLYCSLVPWIFSREQSSFASWASQRRCLLGCVERYGPLTPADIRQCLCERINAECCMAVHVPSHCETCSLTRNGCSNSPLVSPHGARAAPTPSPAATKLAKLHGHLIAQGFMPDTLGNLRHLLQLIIQGPLEQEVRRQRLCLRKTVLPWSRGQQATGSGLLAYVCPSLMEAIRARHGMYSIYFLALQRL